MTIVYEFLIFDGKESTLFGSIGNNFIKTVSVFSGANSLVLLDGKWVGP